MTRGRLASRSKQDARSAIVEAAVTLFAEEGYERTSLEDIADQLGVTKGTIYYHFSKKTEILFIIHDTFIDVLLQRIDDRANKPLAAVDELRFVFRDILWLMEHMHGYVQVFFEEWRALDEVQFLHVRAKRDRYEAHVADVYRRGVAEGSLQDIPANMPVFALFGMANWTYQWYRHYGRMSHRDIAETLADIYFSGVLRCDSNAGR
jgi:TetR/AcrR family transcriptional regulator, cholesterol catabolism regulator